MLYIKALGLYRCNPFAISAGIRGSYKAGSTSVYKKKKSMKQHAGTGLWCFDVLCVQMYSIYSVSAPTYFWSHKRIAFTNLLLKQCLTPMLHITLDAGAILILKHWHAMLHMVDVNRFQPVIRSWTTVLFIFNSRSSSFFLPKSNLSWRRINSAVLS